VDFSLQVAPQEKTECGVGGGVKSEDLVGLRSFEFITRCCGMRAMLPPSSH
jgi:hypothetical protein